MRLRRFALAALIASAGACGPATPAAQRAANASTPSLKRAEAKAAPPEEPLEPPVASRKPPAVAPGASKTTDSGSDPIVARGSMWGEAIGESFGAGGLGLTGIGEGGGGDSEGIGLGSVGTIGHGAGHGTGSAGIVSSTGESGTGEGALGSHPPTGDQYGGRVAAGEWDDNANYRDYLGYLDQQQQLSHERLDVHNRRFIVVRDKDDKPVPSCKVTVRDAKDFAVELRTTAAGRALFFPKAQSLEGNELRATAECQGQTVTMPFNVAADDGLVDLKLDVARTLPDKRTVDIVFILDTTGSMSEEITALRGTIKRASRELAAMNVRVRLGLVEYRDRGDDYLTRLHQMTTDATGFTARVAGLDADGGGDTPEDVNEGLRVAIDDIRWRDSSVARLAFLIGDAPPQLGYADGERYTSTIHRAQRAGIQVFTIAASGMDDVGQVVWRQIAQFTGATNMFVLRGGAGPQSTGGGDPKSSCGKTHKSYTSGNLAELITGKVKAELLALDADPMKVAGLHQDEKAKPCDGAVSRNQP
jgi:Mg-chelatase subunit ChlD